MYLDFLILNINYPLNHYLEDTIDCYFLDMNEVVQTNFFFIIQLFGSYVQINNMFRMMV